MSEVRSRLKRPAVLSIFARLFESKSSKVGAGILAAILLIVILGPFFIHYSPYSVSGNPNSPPSYAHLFGTDYQGKDVLSQIIWGAYPSLIAALFGAAGAVVIGFFAGVLSGYYSKLDSIIGAGTDIVLTFPAIAVMVLVGEIFLATTALLVGLLVVFLWAPVARSVRAQVASVKNMPFVDAAKTSGLSDWQVVLRIIVPEVGAIGIAYFVINVSVSMVIVTALEFLGVGNPEVVSWGTILYWAQQYAFYMGDWWWFLAPGLFIALVAISFAMIGYSVEEILNPRLRS